MKDEELIVLNGLSAQEKLELLDDLGEDAVSYDTSVLPGELHGEPATIALIILSHSALVALGAYLLKKRESEDFSVDLIKIETVGGTKIEAKGVKFRVNKEEQSSPDVVKALNKTLGGALDKFINDDN